MARYLKLDPDQYGVDGLIPLYRGDDWALTGRVIELDQGIEREVNLSSVVGATGMIPAASGGQAVLQLDVVDADCGKIVLSLGAAQTPEIRLSDVGVSPVIVLEEGANLHTLTSVDQALKIQDRS